MQAIILFLAPFRFIPSLDTLSNLAVLSLVSPVYIHEYEENIAHKLIVHTVNLSLTFR